MGDLKYTHHAEQKFLVLKRHDFEVTVEQVEETVLHPDRVISHSGGRFIAQRGITARHVLRVVYRMEMNIPVVITFYPGWKERYED